MRTLHALLPQARWAALAAALALQACTAYSPASLSTGTPEAAIVQALGTPTGRHALPEGGTRLEYSRGPLGVHTYMLDLGADGRLQRLEQVLDAAHFEQVRPGMPQADLLRLLGRPAERLQLRLGAQVWSWRYANNDCLWFRVDLNADGRVKHGGAFMPDPVCDAPSDRD